MPSFAALIASPNQSLGLGATGMAEAETEKSAALFGSAMLSVEADLEAEASAKEAALEDQAAKDQALAEAQALIPALSLVRPDLRITPPQTEGLIGGQTDVQTGLQTGDQTGDQTGGHAFTGDALVQAEQTATNAETVQINPSEQTAHSPDTAKAKVASQTVNHGQATIEAVLQALDADQDTRIIGSSLPPRPMIAAEALVKPLPVLNAELGDPELDAAPSQPVTAPTELAQAGRVNLAAHTPLVLAQQAQSKQALAATSSTPEPEPSASEQSTLETRSNPAVADMATAAPTYSLINSLQAQLQGQGGATSPAQDTAQGLLNPVRHDALSADGLQKESGPNLEQASLAPPASGLAKATLETTAQISAQILRRLEGRTSRFDMTLTPETLGRVDVALTIESDGQVTARLAFDNPAAAVELRGRAEELRRQLAEAGLNLAKENLEFTERNPQHGSGQGAFDRQQDRRAFAGAGRLNDEADLVTALPPAQWATSSQTPDRVDVKV